MPEHGHYWAAKEASVVSYDMAVVVHLVKPQHASIFWEYTQMQLLLYLHSQMTQNTRRVDAVWDTYKAESLKFQTHTKCGEAAGQ